MSRSITFAGLLALPCLGAAWALREGEPVSPRPVERLHWLDAVPESAAAAPTPEVLTRGEALYATRCSICHGKWGEGDGIASAYLLTPPRDFSLGVFKFKSVPYADFPSDEDLFRTVTVGFPAYGMPSFEYLPESDRWALVAYVKHLSSEGLRLALRWDGYDSLSHDPDDPDLSEDQRAEVDEELAELEADITETLDLWFESGEPLALGDPVPESPAAIARGEELFRGEWDCVSCHGETGRGDGPSVNEQMLDDWKNPIRPRDYRSGRWHFKAGDRAVDIVRTLRVGIPGTPMPAFGVKDEELPDVWAVAHYVRSLATKDR